MKNKAVAFRMILLVSSLAFCAVLLACMVLFGGPAERDPAVLVLFGAYSLGFCVLVFVTVGRYARPFGRDFQALQNDAQTSGPAQPARGFSDALAEIGGAPLKALILYLMLAAAFVLSILFVPGAPGAGLGNRGALFTFVLSIAMLSAAFLYVVTDKLTLTTLLTRDLQRYPAALRENRQRRKNLIIPMFTTLMTLLFAYSCAFIIGHRSDDMSGVAFSRFFTAVLPISVVYIGVVLALMFTWGANTALLFRSVIRELELLSSKDRDLTGRISICSVDEIATISGMVNVFCEGLAQSLREIRGAFGQLSRIQASLFEGIRSSSGASGEMAGGIDGLLGMIEREDAAVRRGLDSAQSLAEHVAGVAASSREQTESLKGSVERVQAAMREMGRLSRESEAARTKTAALVETFGTGERNIHTAIETVKAVASRSSDLVEINKLISAVASRTNLLAMNASIEAAHAGDAGSGFSVVANEIRTLAESTAEHTRKSKESLAEILNLITRALEASESTGDSFGTIRASVEELDSATAATAASMGVQERQNGEILNLLAGTERLAQDVARTAQALDEIAHEMRTRLAEAAVESSSASEVSHAMREHNTELRRAVAHVDGLALEASGLNDSIDAFLGSFKA